MKKVLLASTAIVGGALIAAPAAMAGNVSAGDNYSVSIKGSLWQQMYTIDEDLSAGNGRGYGFGIGETEVHVNAKAQADNGLKYGVTLELNASTDDGSAADEVYATISGDNWGTLQLGENDSASNQMKIGSFQANKSGVGTLGGVTALATAFHLGSATAGGSNLPGFLVRADWESAGGVSDSNKVIYFTPRFSGFQLGASHTPDSGHGGRNRDLDNDGDFEKVWDIGANYVGKFGDVGVSVGAAYTTGTDEDATGSASTMNDLEVFTVGAKVNFGGFVIGADYRDNGESAITKTASAAGADAGYFWSVGVGYGMGPWGVDAHYAVGERDNATTAAARTTEVTRVGLGASYAVAPGWRVTGDLEVIDHENMGGTVTDNKAKAFIITNFFNF